MPRVEEFYVDICTHDSDTLAGTTVGGFDVDLAMTNEEIGKKVRSVIEGRNEFRNRHGDAED